MDEHRAGPLVSSSIADSMPLLIKPAGLQNWGLALETDPDPAFVRAHIEQVPAEQSCTGWRRETVKRGRDHGSPPLGFHSNARLRQRAVSDLTCPAHARPPCASRSGTPRPQGWRSAPIAFLRRTRARAAAGCRIDRKLQRKMGEDMGDDAAPCGRQRVTPLKRRRLLERGSHRPARPANRRSVLPSCRRAGPSRGGCGPRVHRRG